MTNNSDRLLAEMDLLIAEMDREHAEIKRQRAEWYRKRARRHLQAFVGARDEAKRLDCECLAIAEAIGARWRKIDRLIEAFDRLQAYGPGRPQ